MHTESELEMKVEKTQVDRYRLFREHGSWILVDTYQHSYASVPGVRYAKCVVVTGQVPLEFEIATPHLSKIVNGVWFEVETKLCTAPRDVRGAVGDYLSMWEATKEQRTYLLQG